MLYIDEDKISAEDLFDKLSALSEKEISLTFKELSNHKVFNVNPVMDGIDLGRTRQRGIKIRKENKGVDELCSFRFTDSDGIEKTIRYTNRNIYINEVTKRPVYSPRYLFITPGEFICQNIDIAVFIYFNPKNIDSPFHINGSNFMFSYNNLSEEADKKIKKGSLMLEALKSIESIPELDLVYFAKGVGILNAENMTSKMIVAELTEKAMSNPSAFLNSRQNTESLFDGKVVSLIEKGVIKLTNTGWFFTQGLRKDNLICNMPHGTIDTHSYLKNYIKQNIEDYYHEIISLTSGVIASKNAQDFLEQMEGKKEKTILKAKPEMQIDIDDIVDFNSAELYLSKKHRSGKVPPKPKTSKFLTQVKAGIINSENIDNVVSDYMAK